MNVITFFRETMWFSRGNYVTLQLKGCETVYVW